MRIAYADPPYLGQAKRHYADESDYTGEVDHRRLIELLGWYDGWALSCSSPSLRTLLPMCPEDVRVMAWVKPFCSFKPNVNPAYAWEPVLVKPARSLTRGQDTVRDWVSANITLQRGLSGAKPFGFCMWLFEVLGMEPDDEFTDLFPGTGAVTEALAIWRERKRLAQGVLL